MFLRLCKSEHKKVVLAKGGSSQIQQHSKLHVDFSLKGDQGDRPRHLLKTSLAELQSISGWDLEKILLKIQRDSAV